MFRRHGRLFSSLPMSQAAVHRPPARFDASVVPGAKPAPFPDLSSRLTRLCARRLHQASAGCTRSSSTATGHRRTCTTDSLPSTHGEAYDWPLRFQTIADALADAAGKRPDPGWRSRRRRFARHPRFRAAAHRSRRGPPGPAALLPHSVLTRFGRPVPIVHRRSTMNSHEPAPRRPPEGPRAPRPA